MGFPSLSIVIPTYNGRAHLERCLPSVQAHAPNGTQVIVVDDASMDGTAEWLEESLPWVELIRLPENRGFCHAVNAGIAQATNEVVELLNNDTEVRLGWAEAALRHFANPNVGSVAPLVLSMDRPEIIDSAGQRYQICGWGQNRGYGQPLGKAFETSCEVFGPSASSGFYRRSALERAGGLLPEFEAYCEDIDLSFRLRWAGCRCIYEPASRLLHKGSASYGSQPDRLVQLISRNEELVYWINLPAAQLAGSLLPHLAFQTVRLLRRLMAGQGRPFLKGKLQALSRWRFVLARRRALRTLAGDRPGAPGLAISNSPRILRDGWSWMTRRQIA